MKDQWDDNGLDKEEIKSVYRQKPHEQADTARKSKAASVYGDAAQTEGDMHNAMKSHNG